MDVAVCLVLIIDWPKIAIKSKDNLIFTNQIIAFIWLSTFFYIFAGTGSYGSADQYDTGTDLD